MTREVGMGWKIRGQVVAVVVGGAREAGSLWQSLIQMETISEFVILLFWWGDEEGLDR